MPVKYSSVCDISICYFQNIVNNENMNDDDILQNLKDAGCDYNITDNIIALIKTGDRMPVLNLLAKHRKQLLISLHEDQKKIDCLDFLIFNLNQD